MQSGGALWHEPIFCSYEFRRMEGPMTDRDTSQDPGVFNFFYEWTREGVLLSTALFILVFDLVSFIFLFPSYGCD